MDLYQAILQRRSVRRYRNRPLDKQTLEMVDDIIDHALPLVQENRFRVMRRDVVTGEDLIAAMGGYGRILTPPHYMVAYAIGDRMPLTDLGYRMEQVAVQMVQIGLSVSFIGSLNREANVRVRFRLNSEARTGAFLIFGYAAESAPDRTINAVLRRRSGGGSRLDVEEFFFDSAFDQPAAPPKDIAQLIEAARRAPSANNAQPWRFLWQGDTLYLFLQKENPRYGNNPALQEYRYFDGGTCMGNVKMAMDALNIPGEWNLLKTSRVGVPDHPETLEPLAKLTLF